MSSNYSNYGSPALHPGPATVPLPIPVQKKRHSVRVTIIILLIAAVGLGALRYFGPVLVTQSFMNDVYSYKFSDALNLVCPSEHDQVQAEFQGAGLLTMFQLSIDTSHLSYSMQGESFSDASVSVTGSIIANSLSSEKVSDRVELQSNGLWWCINADNASSS